MTKVAIIGAGIAGLSAALQLKKQQIDFILFEASDAVGGRVRTDMVEGYTLDRGFQVLLTAYPEAQRLLDYNKLDLKYFSPGALLRYTNEWIKFGDPLRDWRFLLPTITASNASIKDKWLIYSLSRKLKRMSLEEVWKSEETSSIQYLESLGFSGRVIQSFFMPFYRGIFLEKELSTSSRFFSFVFKMFSEGKAAIPAKGMQAIPEQLASEIPLENILLQKKVTNITGNQIFIENGSSFEADYVLLAVDVTARSYLLKESPKRVFNGTCCIYFSSDKAPLTEPILALNSQNDSLINNLCVLTNLHKSFAPFGKELISISVIGIPEMKLDTLLSRVQEECRQWFGPEVDQWEHIRTYNLPSSLPAMENIDMQYPVEKLSESMFACGDYLLNPSLNAAMTSGYSAAKAIGDLMQ